MLFLELFLETYRIGIVFRGEVCIWKDYSTIVFGIYSGRSYYCLPCHCTIINGEPVSGTDKLLVQVA